MPELTPRQRQVLCLVTLTNLEIGIRLGISHQTVKNLLTRAYRRLRVSGDTGSGKRIPALRRALQLGLLTLDEIQPPPPPAGWCWERFAQAQAAARREWKCTHQFCTD